MGILYLTVFLTSALFCAGMIKAGIGDVPDGRSSHVQTTPTGGGVGIVAGLGVGTFLLSLLLPVMIRGAAGAQYAQILSLIGAAALLGLMDDLYNIQPNIKFAVILVLASLGVWVTGPVTQLPGGASGLILPSWLGFAGCILWLFVVTNIVNFMDGINGILIGAMVPAFAALGMIGLLQGVYLPGFTCLFIASGLAGLTPYNFRARARLFAGDIGALLAGFSYGICALWICADGLTTDMGPSSVYVAPVLILPFLADSLLTMLRRAIRKEPLLQAHKSHLYQRLVQSGWSHQRTALAYMGLGLLLIAYTAICYRAGKTQSLLYLIVPSIVLTGIYVLVSLRLSKKSKR